MSGRAHACTSLPARSIRRSGTHETALTPIAYTVYRRTPVRGRRERKSVTVDDARAIAASLPRSYEVVVRGRIKFRIGSLVYVGFSADETIMEFAFPKEWRAALVDAEPEKFFLPRPSDLRFNWICVRLDKLDHEELRKLVVEAWRMCVPKKVSASYRE